MTSRPRRRLPNLALAFAMVVAGTGAGVALHVEGRAGASSPAGSFDATSVEPVSADGTAADASSVGAAAAGDPFGDAVDLGSLRGRALVQPIVGMAATRSGAGYWLAARDGGVFAFGDAPFLGSAGGLNQPVVGVAATPSGAGYWLVARDGGIFAFGDAGYLGSTGANALNQPIVGMAATPSGGGYWLVAADGGVFAFGDAPFLGSAGGAGLGSSVTGMSATPSGRGYRILVDDGRILPFGDAAALAPVSAATAVPAVGITATPDGSGYWAAAANGSVRAYGSAAQFGSADAASPVVGAVGTPSGKGLWMVTGDGDVLVRSGTGTAGTYGFLSKTRADRPMRYDPCTPVRYVINPDGAPAGAVDEVHESFRRLGAAAGITFVDAGTTRETHARVGGPIRPSYQPQRYGTGRWAPILVSWATAGDEPVLAGNVLGYGGSTSYWTSTSEPAYVTGEVVFDRDLSLVRPGFGPGLTRGNLVQHELGHVIGLDHVQDRSQVMFPSISEQSPDGFAGGDRAGLAQLGDQGGCVAAAATP